MGRERLDRTVTSGAKIVRAGWEGDAVVDRPRITWSRSLIQFDR